jgi:predicted naringenin-chalcone synthase
VTTALPRIRALSTARPDHDIHAAFIAWAEEQSDDQRARAQFLRMAGRSGIDHRFAVLPPTPQGGSPVAPGVFYDGPAPGNAARMALFAEHAPALALKAIAGLDADLNQVTHVIVASCTGFVAPGVDQIIARTLNLDPSVERLLVGRLASACGGLLATFTPYLSNSTMR